MQEHRVIYDLINSYFFGRILFMYCKKNSFVYYLCVFVLL